MPVQGCMSTLRQLGFASYGDYLKSGHWITFRLRWLNDPANVKRCLACDHDEIELHHINYQRLGEELPTDVVPLCRAHHMMVHQWISDNNASVFDSHIPIKQMRLKYEKLQKSSEPRPVKNKPIRFLCPCCGRDRKAKKAFCKKCSKLPKPERAHQKFPNIEIVKKTWQSKPDQFQNQPTIIVNSNHQPDGKFDIKAFLARNRARVQ